MFTAPSIDNAFLTKYKHFKIPIPMCDTVIRHLLFVLWTLYNIIRLET